MYRDRLKIMFFLIFLSSTSFSQEEVIVFVGHPEVRVNTNFLGVDSREELSPEEVEEFTCVISQIGDKFIWKSREKSGQTDLEMVKYGNFSDYITFRRKSSTDYIKILRPESSKLPIFDSFEFDYIEHIPHSLGSVNYLGKIARADSVVWRIEFAEIVDEFVDELKKAAEFWAPFAEDQACFSGLDGMQVIVTVNDGVENILSEQHAKDRFELNLRRNGVPLSDSSNHHLFLSLEAIWEDDLPATFSISVELRETLVIHRNDRPLKRNVALWQTGSHGFVGRAVARKVFLESIEEKADRVANLYLSAN